ncbi:CopG family transcriptional regulator [Corynebacterium glucuronolyticum]|uniref:ribbon-helix-helix domain-containing protein n=1 Tax=Corynebacterium glucuronolyticum TaxID=39791 RepID=UPI00191CDBFD|nr:CopG family transcriptional regulator [Corynebacterium glucuronolyticum]QQU88659.1 CopG family transcriptional regulator [Corynebacterium glucuronolyticum]
MPVTFTEEQLEQWVAEAEEGYDVDDLKKRGRGRPGRAADPTHVVAVRLTTDELESLDRLAAKRDLSRSELVRQAIAALTAA